ncbi:MAG: trehalose-phosphatase [Burkholderiaceae bacterium]|jgi:trehalose 6-phosphate phosphatase
MTNLFSNAGHRALLEFVRPDMLCLFDFDGTLAPLVAEPTAATLPHAVQQRLHRLQQHAKVGIVTGRSLADIGPRLEFTPDYLIGNHGIEGLPGWQHRANEFDTICSNWHTALAADLLHMDPGIQLEDKRYSLSLHYRHAQDQAQSTQALLQSFEKLTPAPRVVPGKYVFSLLPPHAVHKGLAVTRLIAQTGASRSLYVGDDVTDEDVFSLQREDLLSVRIGNDAQSAAAFFITDRQLMVNLLDQLLSYLSTGLGRLSGTHQTG